MSRPLSAPRRRVPRAAVTTLLTGVVVASAFVAPAVASAASTPPSPVDTGADAMTMRPASAGWVFTSTANRTHDAPLRGMGLWRDGVATAPVTVPAQQAGTAGAQLSVSVGADRCDGGATMDVSVDGALALHRTVDTDFGVVPVPTHLTAGPHTVTVAYSGDTVTDYCDRALKLYGVTTYVDGTAPSDSMTFGPPSLKLSNQAAGLWHDVVGGTAETVLWSNAAVSRTFTSPGWRDAQVVVTAASDLCDGPARFETYVDGVRVGATDATAWAGTWASTTYEVGSLPAGPHEVRVAFVNDTRTTVCDRNLHLRTVSVHDS